MLIHLPSVASFIDSTDAIVYAAYQNGSVDADSATHVSDCSEHFNQCLSQEDRNIIEVVARYQALHIQMLVGLISNK